MNTHDSREDQGGYGNDDDEQGVLKHEVSPSDPNILCEMGLVPMHDELGDPVYEKEDDDNPRGDIRDHSIKRDSVR